MDYILPCPKHFEIGLKCIYEAHESVDLDLDGKSVFEERLCAVGCDEVSPCAKPSAKVVGWICEENVAEWIRLQCFVF